MKTRTIFNAYVHCRNIMEICVNCRRSAFGIAVGKDEWARKWQRADRLARRISCRINGASACPLCAAYGVSHLSNCKRAVKNA